MEQDNRRELTRLVWAAFEGFGGGFALVHAIRSGDTVVDWELLAANQFVRERRFADAVFPPGTRISSITSEGPSNPFSALLRTAWSTGERQDAPMLVDAPTGASWRRMTVIPLGGDDVAAVSFDLSAILDLQARVEALSEHVWDVVAITDAEARLTWVSPSAERMLGYSPDDLVGRLATELIFADDVDAAMRRFAEVVVDPDASGHPIELRIVDASGATRWFECVGVNQLDNAALRGLVVSLHDIDVRKQGEAALRASEARTRSIVETAGDGIITIDEHGVVETFNHAAERMFGVRAADVVGRTYLDLVPPQSADHLRAHLELERGLPSEPTEVVGRRANGQEFPLQVSLSSVTIDDHVIYTAIVRDVTRQHQIEAQLEHMAMYDDLTGLPNRRALVDRIRAAISRPADTAGHVVGLLCLDLDHFKLVNDTLGQDVGDRLLVLVAGRLSSALSPTDVLARPNGDEFVVLCDVRTGVDSLTSLARHVSNALRPPFTVDHHEIYVTASIGIALSHSSTSTVELLRNADTAMHRAKQRGRGQIEVFDERMRIELAARLGLESALQRALERGELRAVYQPIVDLETTQVVKEEALARWLRPGVGTVQPADFIQVAEDTGLIVPIGEWMLHQATRDAAAWQQARPGVGVAVNVSGRQLDHSDLPSAVSRALRSSGLPADLLTLEITESSLIRDAPRVQSVLRDVRSLGVRLAIDDFGTGYSSLTYLHELPIDELKIDGHFLHTLDPAAPDSPLLVMMVQLGNALGLVTVAEHIDSKAKADVLRQLGCTHGQGYHFGRPRPLG